MEAVNADDDLYNLGEDNDDDGDDIDSAAGLNARSSHGDEWALLIGLDENSK